MGWQIVAGRRRCRADRAEPENLYSTRLIFPFFKRFIPDIGWFYIPLCGAGPGRGDQRGQPDRRPRWPGDQRVLGRGRGVHRARYVSTHREFANYLQLVRIEPAAAELTTFSAPWSARAWGFSGGTRIRPTSSWATSGRWASAALGLVALLIKQEFCWCSSAASSSSRRCR